MASRARRKAGKSEGTRRLEQERWRDRGPGARSGLGVLMRSEWDVHADIAAGSLVPVLREWTVPSADIFAMCPQRANLSAG